MLFNKALNTYLLKNKINNIINGKCKYFRKL